MSLFTTGGPKTPQPCERYADEIAMLDEPGAETPSRIAARAHLAGCPRCQRERQALLAASTILRGRVQALMAQAPTFTETEIATLAAAQGGDGAARRSASGRREEAGRERGSVAAAPALSASGAPSRAVTAPSRWRRALSLGGGVAAIALITSLLALTLTGHLLGRPSSGRRQVIAPSATADPLSKLKVYAPAFPAGRNAPPSLIAYRASDGAQESATPDVPVTLRGVVFSQGVRYQLVMPNTNVSDPYAVIPAIFSATRVSDGQSLWSERIDPIFAPSLILDNGVLYLANQGGEVGVDGRIKAVYAYRASDGARLWRTSLPALPDGPPVVSNGMVYIVAGETAFALRASDGGIVWRAALHTGGPRILSAWPTATSDALYIYTSLESPTGLAGSWGVEVFALRASDGGTAWRVSLGTDFFPVVGPFPPVVSDGVVYVRLASMRYDSSVIYLRLFALRAGDGATLWRYNSKHVETGNTGVPNINPPSVSNGVVYVSEDGGALTALDASDGHTIWRVNVDTTPNLDTYPFSITSPLAVDGAVFVIVDNQIVAVRASDGVTLWRAQCGIVNGAMGYQAYQLVVGP
jgi:outer membrane protein assembly factor BamB